MGDLITRARAQNNLPNFNSADNSILDSLITSVTFGIRKWCRRDFNQNQYDELYNGNGQRRLFLRQYPVLSVQSVRYRPVVVLRIQQTDTSTNQRANVSLYPAAGYGQVVGLTLSRVASGVTTTDTSVLFATSKTLQAVANAVIALGSGWTAQVTGGYEKYPAADLASAYVAAWETGVQTGWAPSGMTCCGQWAELRLHTVELQGYQVDQQRGWLLRAIPYTDPELLHPEDLVWPVGINNFRVQYTAGYIVVPEPVQEACAQWVALCYYQTKRDPGLAHYTAGGVTSVPITAPMPPSCKQLLAPYRSHLVGVPGG